MLGINPSVFLYGLKGFISMFNRVAKKIAVKISEGGLRRYIKVKTDHVEILCNLFFNVLNNFNTAFKSLYCPYNHIITLI